MGKFENLPKVGDRVKIVASDVVSHWNMHWANEVGARLSNGDLVYVSKVTPRYLDGQAGLTIAATPGGDGPRWTIDRFAPVDTATLTIEAGKFYKTRDGRKVGPMEKYCGKGLGHSAAFDQTADFTAPDLEKSGDGGSYTSDGTWLTSSGKSSFDLIAEWIDEPDEQPAKASNDNAEPAVKPKFKVGDRVIGESGAIYTIVDNSDNEHWPLRSEGEFGASQFWRNDGTAWSLHKSGGDNLVKAVPVVPTIVALIEDGAAKPATRPKVHADQASATTEAERLALQFPGQQFGVFVLADSKIADLVNVPTAVLRAA